MKRKKLIWILLGLAFVDILIPIPFFAIFLIYVVVKRPIEVLEYVRRIYAEK